MSQLPDGAFSCDRCGADVGNGGVTTAVVISDIDPDTPGVMRALHLCRDRVEDGGQVEGCAGVLLSPANLPHLASRSPRG